MAKALNKLAAPHKSAGPQSPNLARTPVHITDNSKKKTLAAALTSLLPAWPQYATLVALPVAVYAAQQRREALSNIKVVGPHLDNILRYTPTLQETWALSWPVAVMKVASGSLVHKFGGNPVAENVFRDIPKTAAVLMASLGGLELGKSGYKYGWGNVATAVIKPVCKTATIMSSPTPEAGGILANYVCEPLAHATSLVERDLQDLNKTAALQATFPQYLRLAAENTNIVGLTTRAVMAVPSKAIAPNMFMTYLWGHFAMHVALRTACYKVFSSAQSLLVYTITGRSIAFPPQDGLYSHMHSSYTAADNQALPIRLLISTTPIVMNILPSLAAEFYNTYILMSLLRPMQYAADWVTAQAASAVPTWSQPLLEPLGTLAILSMCTGHLTMKFAHVSIFSAAKISAPTSLAIVALDAGLTYFQLQSKHSLSHNLIAFVNCLFVMSFVIVAPPASVTTCIALGSAWHLYNAQVDEAEPYTAKIASDTLPAQIVGEHPLHSAEQPLAA